MEHQRGSDDGREVNRLYSSSVARFNDTAANETNANSDVNVRTITHPNIMTTQQTQGQGLPNGYGGYVYGSRYPNFAPNFSNNSMQYAYAAPPPQAAAGMNMNGYAVVNVNLNMRGYNGYYPNANAATVPLLYNNPNSYQLQPAERRRPQPQSNRLQTHQLQPARKFDCRRNGRVGAGCMERRRPATSTATDISEENICIGPRYVRICDPETLSADGGEGTHDQYNHPGFITRYENAKFFVIKSYKKEHLLNSIRHGVWTSTCRVNQSLNAAYAEVHGEQSIQGVDTSGHVFLLFSINGRKSFCGVAEMVGPVDFEAITEFWDWRGKFPVKWHIIKDVPFTEVRHIALDNDGNRSIIYGRDVQQVEMEKGQQMLQIFKNYVCRTSLLDEFTLRQTVKVFRRRPASPPPQQHDEQHGQQEEEKEKEERQEEEEGENRMNKEEAAVASRKKEGKEPGKREIERSISDVCSNSRSENNNKMQEEKEEETESTGDTSS